MSQKDDFDIRNFVTFGPADASGYRRAVCPLCAKKPSTKGKDKSKNENLVVGPRGETKCHAGCSYWDIRKELGCPKEQQVAAPPPKNEGSLTEAKVLEQQENLKHGENCLAWLLERGLDAMAIDHYRLGACRSKIGDRYYPSISVPVPDGHGRYHSIKRPIPWVPAEERPEGYKKWSQWGVKTTLWVTHEATATTTEYWLVEGMWDAIALGWAVKHDLHLSTHITICTATAGAKSLPDAFEIDQWMPVQCPIVVWYDKDEAGAAGAMAWKKKLPERVAIADIAFGETKPEGYDVSDALNAATPLSVFAGEAFRALGETKTTSDQPPTPKKEKPRVNRLMDRLISNDDLIANAQDYVEWLVPDLLTQDELFILGMPPRGGKSLFCLSLAKAVATGGNFLDRPVTQGSVLYINMEDSPTKIKQRQQAQDWSEGLPVFWLDSFHLSELDDLKEIAEGMPDLRLVVMDTFSRVRDDNQKESSAELGKLLDPLQEWAKSRGITILITHHTGKVNTQADPNADPFDTLRGSSAIRATCRGAIVIVPGAESYRLIAENGFSDRLDINVRINAADLTWKLIGNWSPRVDGDMKSQILDHLNIVSEATVADIAADLNFNSNSVSTVMSRLQRDGMVTKIAGAGRSPGRYTRSSNLLKQLTTQFEQPNPDTVSVTDLLKQNNFIRESESKSDQLPKSDHSMYQPDTKQPQTVSSSEHRVITFAPIDHFSPTHPKLFEQRCNPDGVSDTCSNSQISCLNKVELGQKVTANRPGLPRLTNVVVCAIDLPPVIDTYGKLSPGVMVWKGKEKLTVAQSDCVRV